MKSEEGEDKFKISIKTIFQYGPQLFLLISFLFSFWTIPGRLSANEKNIEATQAQQTATTLQISSMQKDIDYLKVQGEKLDNKVDRLTDYQKEILSKLSR